MSPQGHKTSPYGIKYPGINPIGFALDVDSYTSTHVLRLVLSDTHIAYRTKWGATAYICLAFNPDGILMRQYFTKTLPEYYEDISRG
tara:strand:+ start:310 stop:570 length:261 start_codon:yes stop_codon:yes gene_type:complete